MSVFLLQVLFYLVYLSTQCTAVVQCVCCTTSTLNVRDAPSTITGNILGTVVPNDCLLTTGCTGGWCSVTFNGRSAFTSHSYVSGPQACGHQSDGSCLDGHCGGYTNEGRTCDFGWGCGYYGAPRGGSTHRGTDVKCSGGQPIYAPFAGIMDRVARPYGNNKCCDDGFEYVSTDPMFPNYKFKVFYAKALQIGRAYSKGDVIAIHIGLHCGCYPAGMTDHSHVEIRINGVVVDPTSFMYCNYRS